MCSGPARCIVSVILFAAVSLAALASQPAAAQGFGSQGFRGNVTGGGPGNIGRAAPGIGRVGPAPGRLNTLPSGGPRFPGVNAVPGGQSNVGRPCPSRRPGSEPGVIVGRPGGSVVVRHEDAPVAAKRGRKPRKDVAKSRKDVAKSAAAKGGRAGATGGAARLPPPAVGEQRFVPDEVLVETDAGLPEAMLNAIARRHRLIRLASFDVDLLGTRLHRWRIADRRAVPAVIAALANDASCRPFRPTTCFQRTRERSRTRR
jgi:hypothetical protein